MKIKSAEFVGAIGQIGQAAPAPVREMPQIAFSGRSNVGKSSLINRVLGRTRTPIARVSKEPGKTQEINFYVVTSDLRDFCLVDLPGYGYARVPEAIRERWRPLIDGYLSKSEQLVGVVQLIDLRHGPTQDDLRSVEYLSGLQLPVLFALTKADKLRAREREDLLDKALQKLRVEEEQVIPVSSLSGEGMETLLESLGSLLGPAPEPSAASGA